jgi:2-keto-3-deoxy-L-rhamnonate aldolase RhmA
MQMRKNPLRILLDQGAPSLATRMAITWPTVIELMGNIGGYDYIEILAEYAPFELFQMEDQARAAELFPHMTTMMKMGQGLRDWLAARALGSGIPNILFADIRNIEDAKACIAIVRADSPDEGGIRSVGQGRDVGVVFETGTRAFFQSTKESVVALMIEKKGAIENLEAILSLPGVDMCQFGKADYSMSVGLVGEKNHPQVQEAERYMIETALRLGVQPRAEIADAAGAEYYLNLGVKHFCLGMDMRILHQWYTDHGAQVRDALKSL